MVILGYILVAFAFVDFAVSWIGIDLYGAVGINLPSVLYSYSPYIVGAIGALLIYSKTSKEAINEFTSNLKENEIIIREHKINVKHGFAKQETGILIITNQRVKYIGGMSVQGDFEVGSKDYEILVENIKSIKTKLASVTIIDAHEKIYKIYNGLFWAKNKLIAKDLLSVANV